MNIKITNLNELNDEIIKIYKDSKIVTSEAFYIVFGKEENIHMYKSYSVKKVNSEYLLNINLGIYVYTFFKDEDPQRILDVIKDIGYKKLFIEE